MKEEAEMRLMAAIFGVVLLNALGLMLGLIGERLERRYLARRSER